jgi:hypothetical protein
MFKLRMVAVWPLAILLIPAVVRGEMIDVTDGDFGSHWTSAHITGGVGTGTFGSSQNLLTGGNPDAYRSSEHIHGGSTPNDVLSWFFNFDSSFTYTPSTQGQLDELSVAFDGIIFASSNNGAAQFGPAVRQGGRIFSFDPMAAGQSNASLGWRSFDFGPLVESDFQPEPDFPGAVLDFASGGPIEFGYWSIVGDFFTASAETGVDNWQLQLEVQPVPEPSSLLCSVIGLFCLVRCRKS